MKKYITLFSLIALFFIGIQQTHAQEPERKSLDDGKAKKEKAAHYEALAQKDEQKSPKFQAKIAKLQLIEANDKAQEQLIEMQEAVTLSKDQYSQIHKVFVDFNTDVNHINNEDIENEGKSKKALEAKATLKEERNYVISKLLDDEQKSMYNQLLERKQYLERKGKSDK